MSDKGFSFESLANYNGIFNSDSSPIQSPYTYPLSQPQYCVQNISDSYKSLDHIFKAHEIMDGTVSSVIVRKTQGLELSEHGIWRFRKRDGTYVDIGKIAINNIFIVNPEPDNPYKFDALFFELVVDNDKAPIVIPYKDLIKKNISAYFTSSWKIR